MVEVRLFLPPRGEECMENCKPVVLVVEDSHIIRMCTVDLVVAAGFEALEASSADEAIQVLEGRSDIHLVSTVVSMPGSMDGSSCRITSESAGRR